MHEDLISKEFRSLAQQLSATIKEGIPSDENIKFLLFFEALRAIDYWCTLQPLLPKKKRLSISDFQMLQWGWNLAAANLFSALKIPGAIPIQKDNPTIKQYAINLLHQFGRSVLMSRTAEMVDSGIVNATRTETGFTVRHSHGATSQFLDEIDLYRCKSLMNALRNEKIGFEKRWNFFDRKDIHLIENLVGNFFARGDERDSLKTYINLDIDSHMLPLIRPWNSGYGIMTAYDATPEVDDHFLAQAMILTMEWREEAGVHPDAKIGSLLAKDITAVAMFIISFHLKHIHFCLLASEHYKEISLFRSLTIWGPREELKQAIADYTGLDNLLVDKCLDAISMRFEDMHHLHKHTTLMMPLIIDLGNGFILRPISSINRNPFLFIRTLCEWREPEAKNHIALPLEGWMRSNIYALFQGTRYLHIEGNVKIRKGKTIITDIDGGVFDRITGELALFQIKWQNFHTNDVRQLRSRASNFVKELDIWADKLDQWLKIVDGATLQSALRLKLGKGKSISSIYLFGISRTMARMQGFGFITKNESLALASWAQFLRIRYEIGPSERVFKDIHKKLQEEMKATPAIFPIPVSVAIGKKIIQFDDMWNEFEE